MWLLSTNTLDLHYFQDVRRIRYAILSHTWEVEEVSFQDMQSKDVPKSKKGYEKIQNCCERARMDGYKYAWIDTCCIDKRSSAELSEAINSMFMWYKQAAVCYAFLSDVKWFQHVLDMDEIYERLHKSRWFTRGWTLQELIAPLNVTFFAQDWKELGTKIEFCQALTRITRVDSGALLGKPLNTFNVGQRMSWAAKRYTTREEDLAYCLLGIFDIVMPLLYGEGKRAFVRLQEQILERTEDWTIFAWEDGEYLSEDSHLPSLLALSPRNFRSPLPSQSGSSWAYSDLESKPGTFEQWEGSGSSNPEKLYTPDPHVVTARGLKMQALCDSEAILKWNHGSPGRATRMLLCRIKGASSSDEQWLSIRIRLPLFPHGITERVSRTCEVVTSRSVEMLNLYVAYGSAKASKYIPLEPTFDPEGERRYQLMESVAGRLFKLPPSLKPAALALRLKREAWCAECRAYRQEGEHHERTSSTLTHNHEAQAQVATGLRPPRFRRRAVGLEPSKKSVVESGNVVSHAVSPALDHFQPNTNSCHVNDAVCTAELDDYILRLHTCFSNIYEELPAPLQKMLLCCSLAVSQSMQRVSSLYTPKPGLGNNYGIANRWLVTLSQVFSKAHSVGHLTLIFLARMQDHRYIGKIYPRYDEGLMEMLFIASIIECSNILVESSEQDQLVLEIAKASFFRDYMEVDAHRPRSWSDVDKKTRWLDPKDLVRCFMVYMQDPPSMEDELVEWLRRGFESWSGYADAEHLALIFYELGRLCSYVEKKAQTPVDFSMRGVARVLEGYALYQGDNGHHLEASLKWEYDPKWQAIGLAVIKDVKSRGPPKV